MCLEDATTTVAGAHGAVLSFPEKAPVHSEERAQSPLVARLSVHNSKCFDDSDMLEVSAAVTRLGTCDDGIGNRYYVYLDLYTSFVACVFMCCVDVHMYIHVCVYIYVHVCVYM